MIVKYNIRQLTGDKFLVSWSQQDENFCSRLRFTDFRLVKLLAAAKQRISTGLNNRAKTDSRFRGAYAHNKYVWDGDISALPSRFAKQLDDLEPDAHLRPAQPVAAEPERLYYIELCVEGSFRGPVLKKADKPLLTWEEACEELKKKVG